MNKLEKERRRVLEEDILQRQWFIQRLGNCGRIGRLCAVQSLKDDPCAGKGRKEMKEMSLVG